MNARSFFGVSVFLVVDNGETLHVLRVSRPGFTIRFIARYTVLHADNLILTLGREVVVIFQCPQGQIPCYFVSFIICNASAGSRD